MNPEAARITAIVSSFSGRLDEVTAQAQQKTSRAAVRMNDVTCATVNAATVTSRSAN